MPTQFELEAKNAAPAEDAVAVTPSDSTDLTNPARALYVGGSGDVNLDTGNGTTIVFTNIVGGTILPIRVKRVRATSTTATGIIALY